MAANRNHESHVHVHVGRPGEHSKRAPPGRIMQDSISTSCRSALGSSGSPYLPSPLCSMLE